MYYYHGHYNPEYEYYYHESNFRESVIIPLPWGFNGKVTLLKSKDVLVETFFLGKRVDYQKLTYNGQEVVYQTSLYKIVYGTSGRSVYVRGEMKKGSPRPRFGPWTVLKW